MSQLILKKCLFLIELLNIYILMCIFFYDKPRKMCLFIQKGIISHQMKKNQDVFICVLCTLDSKMSQSRAGF